MLLTSLFPMGCTQHRSSRVYAVIFVLLAWRQAQWFGVCRCRYPLPVHADVLNMFPQVYMQCVSLCKQENRQHLSICVHVYNLFNSNGCITHRYSRVYAVVVSCQPWKQTSYFWIGACCLPSLSTWLFIQHRCLCVYFVLIWARKKAVNISVVVV